MANISTFQNELRIDHQEGIDLYLKNSYNQGVKEYEIVAGRDKKKAKEDFEK